jgi:hypothetical protein
MNQRNKSAIVQALGYGLAGAAAATLASETANRARPSFSPLDFLSRRRRLRNLFGRRTLAGALFSAPLLGNLIRGRSVKRNLLRSALLGLGAGMGSLAMPQQRGIWGARGWRRRSVLATFGRLLAGGLAAAAASRWLNRTLRGRHTHELNTHEPRTYEQRTRGRQAHEQSVF